ncbi:MucR family transcriptional regulator [Rhodoligotrophos defluvii]|uniref:MucR family transcriptional regulator n=1 Tax=Rhodoligotrophos defluvii TaxID=2561934 RepID=UPI0010C96744|nr:MucR family transcriptional regulator [Rhodoligotrophos defluvii]
MVDKGNEADVELTAHIVSAYVAKNSVQLADLAGLISSVHQALSTLGSAAAARDAQPPTPAVPIKKSVTREYIICLEDGKKFKSLKRHLSTHYNMTPEQYRAKWQLPPDYPMVAPAYAEARSHLARSLGLGRKPGSSAAAAAPTATAEKAADGDARGAAKPKAAGGTARRSTRAKAPAVKEV